MRLTLPVYSDYICPFCYLHAVVLRRIAASDDVDVRWICVEVHPETPRAGRPLSYEGAYAAKWDAYIAPFAAEQQIPLEFPAFLPNTRQALLATAYAETQGAGRAFHDRTMQAYWDERRDIGDLRVLSALAQATGLSAQDGSAWQTPDMEAIVAANRAAAFDDMATGFPTTMLGSFPLIGLQNPEDFRAHLQRFRALCAKRATAP